MLIFFVNFICILRYDKPKRKDFSIVTSTIISIFTSFISSDQPHKFQLISKNYLRQNRIEQAMRKRKLSARMSLLTLPLILACDLSLLLNLKYNQNFQYGDINLTPETTKAILNMLIFPAALTTSVTSIVFYKTKPAHLNQRNGSIQRLHQQKEES